MQRTIFGNDLWDALFYEIKACLIKTKHSYLSFCIKYMTNSTFYFYIMRKWTRYARKCRCFVVEVTVVPLIEDLFKFDRSRKLCWASVVLILLRFASFSNIVINTEKPQIFDQSLEQLAETKTFRLFIKKVNNNIEFID